jgi:hypothetical protein
VAAQSFRYVGTTAHTLESGKPLEPGDFVYLDDEELGSPYNQTLLDEGVLIKMDPPEEKEEPSGKESGIKSSAKSRTQSASKDKEG